MDEDRIEGTKAPLMITDSPYATVAFDRVRYVGIPPVSDLFDAGRAMPVRGEVFPTNKEADRGFALRCGGQGLQRQTADSAGGNKMMFHTKLWSVNFSIRFVC